uniref:Uncharacterized protein n=1 Tax=Kalanchoe fedtschenkoi TaxID=63787 RepID=A0A7N0RHA6_KALFE
MSVEQLLKADGKKGGLITMPFIIANEAFEEVSSYGLLPNMILYLMQEYGMELVQGTYVVFLWTAATNFTPLVGAFVADSYLGRFLCICLGSISSLLGMILLWLTAMFPKLRPSSCYSTISGACKRASPAQLGLLYSSFALMSIGAGGIRPCSLAFGADQLDNRDSSDPSNKRILESYFSWYYASATASVLISFTGIVYIQDHLGWKIGYGVPAVLMFLSASSFLIASSLYVKHEPSTNLLVSFAQVIVASYRKRRNVPFPTLSSSDEYYHHGKGSEFQVPTDKFFNKACVVTSYEDEVMSDGSVMNPWRTCTVEQVEQLKSLIRVLPIWSTGIIMAVSVNQGTFLLVQAEFMDRHLTRSFEIPAGSFGSVLLVTLVIWVLSYDRAILPLASKLCGKPVDLGVKLRMGIGLLFSCSAMVVAAIVEHARRRQAVEIRHSNSSGAVVTMSALWLAPQLVLMGVAQGFNSVAQMQFYYSECPKSMSSIAGSLFGLGTAMASLLASAILSMVDGSTSRNGGTSWVSSDINAAQLDLYYWLLAAMSLANVVY